MTDPVVAIDSVTRRFGRKTAVDHFSLEITAGSITGLLGTNGAGQTTLIRMLVGHLYTDSGTIRVLGQDPWHHDAATLRRIACVSDSMQLPSRMKLGQMLQSNQMFFPLWNQALAEQLLERFQLSPNDRYSALSFGQKRRAVLLQALCQGADLLILDEPTFGLDALVRRQFLDQLLANAVDQGQTVLLSSHLLTDVERVVDRIAIMSEGRLMMSGNLDELKTRLRRIRIAEPMQQEQLAEHFSVLEYRVVDGVTEVLVDEFEESHWESFQRGCGNSAHAEQLNLEEMFVEMAER